MKKLIGTVSAIALLAVPATAGAHVTLNPNTAEAEGFTALLIRVPNERDNANTTKVDMQFPPGFVFASYQPKPGWSFKVTKRKLATPVKTDDGEITEEVARITITGTGTGQGKIGPGEFQDFPLSVRIPDKVGQTLWFPTLQTYSNGEVVRWISEEEEADKPAPHVDVTAAEEEGGGHGAATPTTTTANSEAASESESDDDGASTGLVIAALVLGALGLIVGIAALMAARRPRTAG